MAFTLKDRVKDTTTTTGTGTITLSGTAPTGYQAFSAIGNGNSCSYTIAGGSEWEVGIGTYTASGTTLSRDTVLASSNGGSLVSFSAGTKDVFVSLPAEMLGYQLIGSVNTTSGTSVSFTSIPATYSDLLIELLGLSHDSGSAQQLQIEITDNNGTNWTAVTAALGTTFAASATLYGSCKVIGYRRAAGGFEITTPADLTADRTVGSSLSARSIPYRLAAGINGLRWSWTGSANFDAGSWKLWGRL